jgi:uncharacterized protein (TIGR00730 family)
MSAEPFTLQRICVFTGSRPGDRPEYAAHARALGEALARRQIDLVYGGGHVGLMGILADATLAAGGDAIGVIPEALLARELAHPSLTHLHVVGTMHERKAMMATLADAFIALPGGFGTLEELFEVVTWAQLGIHAKPVGLLNTAGFFDSLLTFLRRAVDEGFIPAQHTALFVTRDDPVPLLDALTRHHPPPLGPKWLDKSQT